MRSASNCPRPVLGKALYNHVAGELLPLPCGMWSCPVCGPGKAHRLGLLAAAAAPERFVTLSRVGPDLKTVHERLKTLSKSLRRSGKGWEYLAVPEIHQNGSWHLHLLQRGDFVPQRELSRRADSAGMGRVVHIQRVKGGRHEISAYLCKYLTKQTLTAEIGRQKGSRRFRTSRNFWPGGLEAVRSRAFGISSTSWSVEDVGPYVERS